MLERLSHEELSEYFALYLLEPFGEIRGDLRAAHQTAYMVACSGSRPGSPRDYMPFEHQRYDVIDDWQMAKAMLCGRIENATKQTKIKPLDMRCLDDG